jgi:hypothetical protein
MDARPAENQLGVLFKDFMLTFVCIPESADESQKTSITA